MNKRSIEIELPNGKVVINTMNIVYVDAPHGTTEIKKSENDKRPENKFLIMIHFTNGTTANFTFDTEENRQVEYNRIKNAI